MHPSSSFPGNFVVLSGSNAFTDKTVFAIYNPTASIVSATVEAPMIQWNGSAYVENNSSVSIDVQPGATFFGKFSSVAGSGLIAYF
jgi:hypothetical protein